MSGLVVKTFIANLSFPLTKNLIYLEDGDWTVLSHDDYIIFDEDLSPVQTKERLSMSHGMAEYAL